MMPASEPERETRIVTYGGPDYERLAASVEAAARRGSGARLLFAGDADEAVGAALQAMARRTAFHVHQVNLATLVEERDAQTQANLRETFDSAPQDSVLLFYNADGLLARDAAAARDALTPADYLFRRMKAFKGISILYLRTSEHVRHARTVAPGILDAEIHFGEEAPE